MKALIQRVSSASVCVDGSCVGSCGNGYMILFCAVSGDTIDDVRLLAEKTVKLRVFTDENDKMNLSLSEVEGEVLCISQFTLAADTRKGNRPSFVKAMEPKTAEMLYNEYCRTLSRLGVRRVEKGIFGADMKVSLINDGPVTVLLDTDIWKKG